MLSENVKQALTYVSEMIIREFDITKNNVLKLDLKKLAVDFGVKSQYSEFVAMTIATSFEYY